MTHHQRITIETGKRGGKPCIRSLRITVYDVLEQLAAGLSYQEILEDFPELEQEDIIACLAFAADKELINALLADEETTCVELAD